jgi:hypothetical protein
MKKIKLAFAALAISTGMLLSFNTFPTSTIKGTVTPADKAIKAWAISPTDTLVANVLGGTFEIKDVKAGTYSIIIEAEEPFTETRKNDAVVKEGTPVTDVGEIKLQPKKDN